MPCNVVMSKYVFFPNQSLSFDRLCFSLTFVLTSHPKSLHTVDM